MIELKAGPCTVVLRPELGGAVGAWTREHQAIFHPVTDPKLVAQRGEAVAAYPLIPFSNRVADGRFSFGGESFQLDRNFGGEPHAIHGNAWERPWAVLEQTPARALLALDHTPPRDPPGQWPFCYRAEIEYALREDGLSVHITVRNTDRRPQPVGLGFHPFFPRDADLELGFSARDVWGVGPDALPRARVPVAGDRRFSPMRAVSGPPLDNCFSGWNHSAFLRWPSRGLALTVTAMAPFDHLVVFTPPGRPYVAVEPASNMTDAINHPEIEDRGLVVLQPDAVLDARVEFALMRL